MRKISQFILFLSFLSSCGNGDKADSGSDTSLAGEVRIDGSSTVYPITEAVAEDFGNENKGVVIAVAESGTGGGFKKFGRGEIDINDASRPIKSTEDSLCKTNNISYIELLVAFDGLAVVVNPQNDWCKDITVAELKMLWEPAAQGKITKWSQVRNGWPDQEIHLFGAGSQSGTFDYFTEAIVGISKASRGDYTASEDDNVLVQGIAGDKYALGFFGLAYFASNKDKLKLVAVNSGNGPVLPSVETVKNKSYTPLGRPLFIYVSSSAVKRPEVVAFTEYYLDQAAKLSEEVGYVPLSEDETKTEKEKFQAFVSGLQ
ncbi:MAG TPA: PstS family phosphate ABC transporter substrate-binding protein [Bacteroidia bacterium]|nr:PstS family phosphate ABC transporter substrate-binding protein [Bacteroidia bacterium]